MTKGTSVEMYDKISQVLKELYLCTERAQIDKIFSNAKISSPREKINLLRKCMEVENVYGTPEKVSDEDEYDFECAVFEEGTWRMLN